MPGRVSLQAEQTPLPGDEQLVLLTFVARDRFQRISRCDESRFDLELCRCVIPLPPQFVRAAFHFRRWPRTNPTAFFRPFALRQLRGLFRRGQKVAPPPRGKMTKIRDITGIESSGGRDQLLILQNMKWRSIQDAGFPIAPMPKRAQDRSRSSTQCARPGNSPHFIFIALTLDARLRDCALTRFAKPIETVERAEFAFQFFRQRKQIMRVVHGVLRHALRKRALRPICFLRSFR